MRIDDLKKHVEKACESDYVFQNEEQFRYALVKELENAYQKRVIVQKLEIDPTNNEYIYIDIVIKENENEYDFIELKYGTVGTLKNDLISLSPTPIPDNNSSYRKTAFKKDVDRLNELKQAYDERGVVINGFVVLLINHDYKNKLSADDTFSVAINRTDFTCFIENV